MVEKSKTHEANARRGAVDAKKATADYEMAAVALRAKTERLKALRLARDGAAAERAPVASKRGAKAKGGTGNLSAWLDGEAKEGRRG